MRNAAIAAILALSACGSVGTVISDYGPVRPVTQGNWKFYDKPEEGRMMVAPTVGAVRTQEAAIWSNATLFQSAAQDFLSPRGCTATGVKPLVKAQMEVTYTC